MDIIKALGYGAAGLLVLSNVYTPFKWLRKFLYVIEAQSANRQLGILQKELLNLHCYVNVGATILSFTHSVLMKKKKPHKDVISWIALALMSWLSISGYIMRTKWFPSTSRRAARLLHLQYIMTVILIASLSAHVILIED